MTKDSIKATQGISIGVHSAGLSEQKLLYVLTLKMENDVMDD